MGALFRACIAGRPEFVALKESTGNMKRRRNCCATFRRLLCAAGLRIWRSISALGAHMWICATSNFAPQLILDLYEASASPAGLRADALGGACRNLCAGGKASSSENLILEWTYNSNAIEGNTLTLQETKVVMEGITVGGKSLREHFTNHREAIAYIEEIVRNNEPLTEWQIKNMS